MEEIISKIESLRYDIETGKENDVIKISVRLIEIRSNIEQLRQYNVVGQSEQLVCEYCNEDAKPTCCDSCLDGMVNAVQNAN